MLFGLTPDGAHVAADALETLRDKPNPMALQRTLALLEKIRLNHSATKLPFQAEPLRALAAALGEREAPVIPQQSQGTGSRPAASLTRLELAMDQNTLRVPAGISHVVLDTPGGLQGFELARVVMFADAIVMPVCPSMFDRESAAMCHAELSALPRVATGRCRVGVVGMRIDGRTHGAGVMRDWADALGLPLLGTLRETTVYTRALEKGLTIFDIMGRALYGRFMALSLVSVCALAIAAGLVHVRWRRLA
jgi:hypothetical protein